MKVLAIIGSPRKGHTYHIVQQIEQQLMQTAGMQFEYVFLSQLNLQPCRGCYVCQSRGEQYCPLKDDLSGLIQKMKAADGVIFASPVYTANVPALVKNLMDRMAFAAHRPAFLGKPAMLVATASSGTADTLKILGWFRYTGFQIVARLGIPVWPSPRTRWTGEEARERKIKKAAARFERALAHPPTSMSLEKVLQFYLMKTSVVTDPKFFAADDEYHQSLPMPASWWKKALGQALYWVVMKGIRSQIATVKREKITSSN